MEKVYVGEMTWACTCCPIWVGETFPGKIFIRSGAGEFRTAVKSDDVEESGKSLENCYGLTVHDMQDDWRSYTTIWDDGIAREAGCGGSCGGGGAGGGDVRNSSQKQRGAG